MTDASVRPICFADARHVRPVDRNFINSRTDAFVHRSLERIRRLDFIKSISQANDMFHALKRHYHVVGHN
jgi:hypothetical protein